MFDWLKKKSKPKTPKVLYFKSNDAAFEYAAEYMRRPLSKDAPLVGQVIAKVNRSITSNPNMQQMWKVRLATEHGPQVTQQCGSISHELLGNLKLTPNPIEVGDLVAVEVAAYIPTYPFNHPMQYFVILFKLRPEVDLTAPIHILSPDIDPPIA